MRTIYISASLSTNDSSTNTYNTEQLRRYLQRHGYNYKQVQGCYKGTKELSYQVSNINDRHQLNELLNLAQFYNQESILIVDEDNFAYIKTSDNLNTTPIGTFTEVSKESALSNDAYTYDAQLDKYYTCK